jgi:hypothetical protein
VHEAILARIQDYLRNVIDSALARVRRTITVDQVCLSLSNIELTQRVSVTGSLKAAITELVALTGAGEMAILARYAVEPAAAG